MGHDLTSPAKPVYGHFCGPGDVAQAEHSDPTYRAKQIDGSAQQISLALQANTLDRHARHTNYCPDSRQNYQYRSQPANMLDNFPGTPAGY